MFATKKEVDSKVLFRKVSKLLVWGEQWWETGVRASGRVENEGYRKEIKEDIYAQKKRGNNYDDRAVAASQCLRHLKALAMMPLST